METYEERSLFRTGKAVEDGEADKEEDSKKMVVSGGCRNRDSL